MVNSLHEFPVEIAEVHTLSVPSVIASVHSLSILSVECQEILVEFPGTNSGENNLVEMTTTVLVKISDVMSMSCQCRVNYDAYMVFMQCKH